MEWLCELKCINEDEGQTQPVYMDDLNTHAQTEDEHQLLMKFK